MRWPGGRTRAPQDWGLRGGLASQAFSSASNFLLVVSVARIENPATFGAFALAYSLFLVVLGTVRGLIGEVLSVQSGARSAGASVTTSEAALGASVVLGVVIGIPVIGVGALLSPMSELGRPLVLFGFGMPLLLAQDAARYAGFSLYKSTLAARSDCVWLTVQIAGTVMLYGIGRASSASLTLLWCLAAGCGWLAIARSVGRPAVTQGASWLRRTHRTGLPFAAEFLLGPGSTHAMLYIVGGAAGVPAAGALRAAQTIFGPLNTLLLGIQAVALPEAAQGRAVEGSGSLRRFVRSLSGAFGLCAAGFGGAILFLPEAVGVALFGATWEIALPLLLPLGIRFVAAGIARGYLLGLRAGRAILWSLRIRAVTGIATLVLTLLGVAIGGVTGAAYGLALAHVIGLVMAYWAFRHLVSE